MSRRGIRSLPVLLVLLGLILGTAAAQSSVSVQLDEWSVAAQPGSVEAGSVTFDVSNAGSVAPHQLVVIRTDLAADALPVVDAQVDEGQVDVVATSGLFPVGQSGTLDATLQAGSYVLICNLDGHYELGMRTGFSVTGAPPAAPPAEEDDDAEPPTGAAPPAAADDDADDSAPPTARTGSGGLETGSGWMLGAVIASLGALLLVAAGRRLTGGSGAPRS